MSDVAQCLQSVRERIAAAARRCGRSPDSARLIAVSKRKPATDIREAYAAGQRDFGENYAQELVDKATQLQDLEGIRWHMIGHLQRNKVRQILPVVHAIHTVDSVRLATELGRRAEARGGPPVEVLVEVNVSGEASKSGCEPSQLAPLLEALRGYSCLSVHGLMTVPPASEDPEHALPYFERLRSLRDAQAGSATLPDLSMGMTSDLEQAVAAGATWVRVGTAIFGARPARIES